MGEAHLYSIPQFQPLLRFLHCSGTTGPRPSTTRTHCVSAEPYQAVQPDLQAVVPAKKNNRTNHLATAQTLHQNRSLTGTWAVPGRNNRMALSSWVAKSQAVQPFGHPVVPVCRAQPGHHRSSTARASVLMRFLGGSGPVGPVVPR